MASQEELKAKLDELQTSLDAKQEEIKAAIQKLLDEIEKLKAAGVDDASIAKLDEIIVDLKSTLSPETPPEPTP